MIAMQGTSKNRQLYVYTERATASITSPTGSDKATHFGLRLANVSLPSDNHIISAFNSSADMEYHLRSRCN